MRGQFVQSIYIDLWCNKSHRNGWTRSSLCHSDLLPNSMELNGFQLRSSKRNVSNNQSSHFWTKHVWVWPQNWKIIENPGRDVEQHTLSMVTKRVTANCRLINKVDEGFMIKNYDLRASRRKVHSTIVFQRGKQHSPLYSFFTTQIILLRKNINTG